LHKAVSSGLAWPGTTKYSRSTVFRFRRGIDGCDWAVDWTVALLSADAENVPAAIKPRDRTAIAAIFETNEAVFGLMFNILLLLYVILALANFRTAMSSTAASKDKTDRPGDLFADSRIISRWRKTQHASTARLVGLALSAKGSCHNRKHVELLGRRSDRFKSEGAI
jgi:hypothetical protein